MKGGKIAKGFKREKPDDILACLMPDAPHPADACRFLATPRIQLIQIIRDGLPGEIVVTLSNKMRVPRKEIAGCLHTTSRTIQRHIEAREKLSPDMSDRLAQVITVFCRSNEVFKDEEKASTWLKSPNFALGGVTPFSLLDTTVGIDMVLDELGRIEHGVFA